MRLLIACWKQSLQNNKKMKRKTASFTGMRPIFTGSPSIVQGGFNLDVQNQSFEIDSIIPAGSLAIFDEQKRLVQIVKTSEVVDIDADNSKRVSLRVAEFFEPIFVKGEKVAKADAISGKAEDAATIESVERTGSICVVTLDKAIDGLVKGDTLEEVIADASGNAVERGLATSVTIKDVEVNEFETPIDVSADTMQYALLERRVTPIPNSQKDTTGLFLKGNPNIKLSKSY